MHPESSTREADDDDDVGAMSTTSAVGRSMPELEERIRQVGLAVEAEALPPPKHSDFLKGLVGICNMEEDEPMVAFSYIHKDLKLSARQVERLRRKASEILVHEKKLILILDIDHILLHSASIDDLTQDELYLLSDDHEATSTTTADIYRLDQMVVKLRPFVRPFLRQASTMFEMYLFTARPRPYALMMAKLLDPEGVYFDSKVISGDDSCRKSLDVVLGYETMTVILDDSTSAWMDYNKNRLFMLNYNFFASDRARDPLSSIYPRNHGRSLAEKREDEGCQVLRYFLRFLDCIHGSFYLVPQPTRTRDERSFFKPLRSITLKGCKIVFSHEFSIDEADRLITVQMAEALGATCSRKANPSVTTHVVSCTTTTPATRWALRNNIPLIRPDWIHATFLTLHRQPV